MRTIKYKSEGFINTDGLASFLRAHKWAVQSSVSAKGTPQSALVGIAVNEKLELIFDTLATTRKVANLRANPAISFVIGGWDDGDERSLQYEGVADFPTGDELEQLKEFYFSAFPDGRTRRTWAGITYVRVRPTWVRLSNYNFAQPEVFEQTFAIGS